MQMSLDTAMEHTFSVAEFSQLISDLLAQTFPHDVWVQGEIRGINRAQSGHVYFDLVDSSSEPGRTPDALVPVVLFDGTKKTVNAQIKRSGGGMRIDDGVAVRIRAVPNFYAPQGKLSLRMTGIDPAYTLGQLAASRELLLRKLSDEGLMDRNAKLTFPLVPLRVGLVTAAGSAAHADFLDELRGADLAFQVVLASTPVQGVGAARRIAASIRVCQRHGVDVIAVVRGGGARTDMVAFDDELVARAIGESTVPVIAGIGHEIDTSVADHVVCLALKTPTACAAHLVEAVLNAERAADATWNNIVGRAAQQLEQHDRTVTAAASTARDRAGVALRAADIRTIAAAHRVRELVATRLERAKGRLSSHIASSAIQARHVLRDADHHCNRASDRLRRTSLKRLADAEALLERTEHRTRLLDPARALARGWSITTTASGDVVRSVTDAPSGARLATRVTDGRIVSTVETTMAPDQPED